jgi:hypothetical protein
MAPNSRWEGSIEEKVHSHEKQLEEVWTRMHAMNNRVFVLELVIERNKGRLEGGKAVAIMIGSLIGSMVGAAVTWFVGRP